MWYNKREKMKKTFVSLFPHFLRKMKNKKLFSLINFLKLNKWKRTEEVRFLLRFHEKKNGLKVIFSLT